MIPLVADQDAAIGIDDLYSAPRRAGTCLIHGKRAGHTDCAIYTLPELEAALIELTDVANPVAALPMSATD